jgi:hypothetical protein
LSQLAYQEKFQAQQLRQLKRKAAFLGFAVVPMVGEEVKTTMGTAPVTPPIKPPSSIIEKI